MRQAAGIFVLDWCGPPFELAAAELIVHHIDDDAIEEGREPGFAPEMRQRTEEPQKHFLRQVLETIPLAGHAGERAKDHRLMALDKSLEILQACETSARGNCFMKQNYG